MIVIGRSIVHPYITNEYEPFAAEKQQILSIMAGNQEVYSFEQLMNSALISIYELILLSLH